MAVALHPPHPADLTEPTSAPYRLLALSAELAGTRACLIEPVAGAHRLVGWLNLARSGETMLPLQVAETCRRLGARLGSALWDEELSMPFMRSINPVRYPPVQQVAATVSARGPVRVFLAVLTQNLTGAAVRAAVAASPATVVGEVVYDVELEVGHLATMLGNSQPDVVVVAGGFDRAGAATQAALLALCRMVASAVVRMPRSSRPPVLFAGSVSVAEKVPALFRIPEGSLPLEMVDNVLPEPNLVRRASLARVLNYHYWRLTQRILGFKEMARWVTSPGQAVTVETSFVQMMQAWAFHRGLPWIHGLYAGPGWWLHVWTGMARAGAQVLYSEPGQRPETLDRWPPLTLVCGEWPVHLWEKPANGWWDKRALAPVVAALGQASPRAMIDVLEHDILLRE
jgi:hypothetical protein